MHLMVINEVMAVCSAIRRRHVSGGLRRKDDPAAHACARCFQHTYIGNQPMIGGNPNV